MKLKAGIKSGIRVSGKDMFDFNPHWAIDADGEENALDITANNDDDAIMRGESIESLQITD